MTVAGAGDDGQRLDCLDREAPFSFFQKTEVYAVAEIASHIDKRLWRRSCRGAFNGFFRPSCG